MVCFHPDSGIVLDSNKAEGKMTHLTNCGIPTISTNRDWEIASGWGLRYTRALSKSALSVSAASSCSFLDLLTFSSPEALLAQAGNGCKKNRCELQSTVAGHSHGVLGNLS